MIEHPKVFMSYSHDSEEHKKWVAELATNLRRHGVDIILDQWDMHVGKNLRFFMEHGLNEAKLVICICSENYVKKADAGEGGVGYESTILTGSLLRNSNTDHILPIIKNNKSAKKTPTFLTNKLYSDFESGDEVIEYINLLERIYGEDINKKPPLGECPFRSKSIDYIKIKTDLERNKYKSIDTSGFGEMDYTKNNGIYSIGVGSFFFTTRWSGCSDKAIYACSDNDNGVGYKDGCVEFPDENGIKEFDFSSWYVEVGKNEIAIFENEVGNLLAVKILEIESKSHGQKRNYFKFEYKVINSLMNMRKE